LSNVLIKDGTAPAGLYPSEGLVTPKLCGFVEAASLAEVGGTMV
jgi:hypothetical protein